MASASAAEVKEKILAATSKVEISLSKYSVLNFIEEKVLLPRVTIVSTASLLLFSIVYTLFGPAVICNLVGFLYPGYASFRAIESPQKDDDTQWLTYWVVFATFTVLEAFAQLILYWFPFYYSAKFGFLIWMFMPNTRGSIFLYNHFLRPIFIEASCHLKRSTPKRNAQEAQEVTLNS